MGLDTSHDCWHGSYGSFGAWRRSLAVAAGYGLRKVESGILAGCDQVDLDYESYEWCNYMGMWQEEPQDALLVLLIHSDCDGYLFPNQYGKLAMRLTQLLPKLTDDWHRKATERFIAGLGSACSEAPDGRFDEWYGDDVVVFS